MYDILAYRIKRPKLTYSRKNPLENIGGKERVRTKKERDREREGMGSLTPTQRQGDIYNCDSWPWGGRNIHTPGVKVTAEYKNLHALQCTVYIYIFSVFVYLWVLGMPHTTYR